MCNYYVFLTTSVVLLVSLVLGIMLESPPLVVGADLDIWQPPQWPAEHTDPQGRALPYKEGGRYQNPWMAGRPSVLSFFKFWLTGRDDSNIPSARVLEETLPVKPPVWLSQSDSFSPSDARLTWLGHASVLAEIDGFTILTDPQFSDRASLVQLAGPKRFTAPACKVSELPNITAVVISHNHYDHLDLNTVRKLAKLQPNIQWFVPFGMGEWLRENTEVRGETVRELSWWEEREVEGGLRIAFTPANHWCKRGVGDDNKMLWGSWAILGPTRKFWFGGDTGYCETFKHIGEKYGPFDLAAIPIGAYQPNWFMKYQHVHPGEAVEIHKDIASRKSLGIHWGTFKLTTEFYLEPPSLLNTYLNMSGLENDVFVTTDIGDSIQV